MFDVHFNTTMTKKTDFPTAPTPPVWIDTHAHLDMGDFEADRPQVLERAWERGLAAVITIGIDLESSRQALALAETNPHIWATVGLHPHEASAADEPALSEIRVLAGDPKVVAIGEIGLDFFRNYSPREHQKACFRRCLQLARECSLPIVIHDREAHEETLQILAEEKAWEIGGLFHCFSGDWALARRCLDWNFFLSVTGALTYKKGSPLEEVVLRAPLESLLLETDAPFLAPHPFRGKRNEPAYLVHTAARLAEIRGIPLAELAPVLYQNTCRAFRRGEW